ANTWANTSLEVASLGGPPNSSLIHSNSVAARNSCGGIVVVVVAVVATSPIQSEERPPRPARLFSEQADSAASSKQADTASTPLELAPLREFLILRVITPSRPTPAD